MVSLVEHLVQLTMSIVHICDSCLDFEYSEIWMEFVPFTFYFSIVIFLLFLQKVQHVLWSVYESQLFEKEHSGYHALLTGDKVFWLRSCLFMNIQS